MICFCGAGQAVGKLLNSFPPPSPFSNVNDLQRDKRYKLYEVKPMTENHNDLNSELPQCLTGTYERTNTRIYSDDVTIVSSSSYNTPKKEDRVGDISGYLSYYIKIIEAAPNSRYIALC